MIYRRAFLSLLPLIGHAPITGGVTVPDDVAMVNKWLKAVVAQPSIANDRDAMRSWFSEAIQIGVDRTIREAKAEETEEFPFLGEPNDRR